MRAMLRGREVVWDAQHSCWLWADIGLPAQDNPRPCPQCGEMPSPEGHDACIASIPGANSACCGHGKHLGYINWPGVAAPPEWKFGAYMKSTEEANQTMRAAPA